VPKSKVRKKTEPTPRTSALAPGGHAVRPSPRWYPIVLAAILLIGLAWIVVYYLAGSSVPVMQDLGAWNFAVGFGFMIIGLGMAVRWH
jgi:cell division protein CrgA